MSTGLDKRLRQVLFAVITEYISSGQPVSSRRISRRYGIELSPASVRNVLADLEEYGLLHQPHTSAGRVPTDAGFRYFVDAMARVADVADTHRQALTERLSNLTPDSDAVLETCQLLSNLTGAATIFTKPPVAETVLSQLRFMELAKGRILAVLVMRSGTVENRVLQLSESVDAALLERVNNYVSSLAPGLSLDALRNELASRVADQQGQYDLFRTYAKAIVEATVVEGDPDSRVVIEGQGALFGRPEFSDAAKIRSYLRAFEDKRHLLELLEQTLKAHGVKVFIGAEAALDEVRDISVISSSYRRDGSRVGSLGIVGPTRMDYGRFVPLVRFAANLLSDVLDSDEEPPEPQG